MTKKTRLDVLLVDRGLVESRQLAQRLIVAGKVHSQSARLDKPGQAVPNDIDITLSKPLHPYVSRGGVKLEHALKQWNISPEGWICSDFGSSTGGFTDCLLQSGAEKVYAYDVGKGQMHWRLRNDSRVILSEGVNVRHLTSGAQSEKAQLLAVDLSFISLIKVWSSVLSLLEPQGIVIALVKPQFEVGKGRVGKKGIIRSAEDRLSVLKEHIEGARTSGLCTVDILRSPIEGSQGNIEYLSLLVRPENLSSWRAKVLLPVEAYPDEEALKELAN